MKKNDPKDVKTLEEIFQFPNGDLVRDKVCHSGQRIRGAFTELFSGYGISAEDILNETITIEKGSYSGYVAMRDIEFYTFCEHHFLPFYGLMDVAYEPSEVITGIGKLVRLVRDVHARRLQIQETMTRDIANDLMRVLGANGACVRSRAKHMCICSRGPGDGSAWTEVVYGTGCMERQLAAQLFSSGSLSPARW
jgi:GTP cyclohydrolase IA